MPESVTPPGDAGGGLSILIVLPFLEKKRPFISPCSQERTWGPSPPVSMTLGDLV